MLPAVVERPKQLWPVKRGVYLRCAMCKQAIEGPCFLCIDCDACCSCLKCANGFGAASGGRHAPESHVFAILWKNEDLHECDAKILVENHLTVQLPICLRPDCGRTTWNGKPNGYCSRVCRDGGPVGVSICLRPGCGRATWDGKPGGY